MIIFELMGMTNYIKIFNEFLKKENVFLLYNEWQLSFVIIKINMHRFKDYINHLNDYIDKYLSFNYPSNL